MFAAKFTKHDTSSCFLNCLIFGEYEVNCEVVDKTFDAHVLLLYYNNIQLDFDKDTVIGKAF